MNWSIFMSSFVAAALASRAYAYFPADEGAFNVRHFHIAERDLEDGEIVERTFLNIFDLEPREGEFEDLEARRGCTAIPSCGTPFGCMAMSPIRSCPGVPWKKSFQDAARQTGRNAKTALKLVGESLGRSPFGGAANIVKAAIVEGKKAGAENKTKKAPKPKKEKKAKAPKPKKEKKAKATKSKKGKREYLEDDISIVNRRDFEFVERDENMEFVQRGDFSHFELVSRNEDGEVVYRECGAFNGEVSCS